MVALEGWPTIEQSKTVFLNEYCRAMEAQVAEGTGRTQWHRHATDSVYIVLPLP